MPYCFVSKSSSAEGSHGIRLFYQTYGCGPTKVLLIIGFAGTHDSWGPQVKGLTGTMEPNDEEAPAAVAGEDAEGIEVCCFDNRGMGRSSVPKKISEYTTVSMAKDALALLDHLGWRTAHIFGHSMGSMIASKVAAIAPERVLSLALMNTTGGGFECLPKINWRTISIAFRLLRAKTPEQRAAVDLEAHYTAEFLGEHIGSSTRRNILYQEYVKGISSTGMQSSHGFEGQVNACWKHKLTSAEIDRIRSAGILISIVHGRDDIIAQFRHAKKLAGKLYPTSKMVELQGGHMVGHERPEEVNQSLMDLIKASKSKVEPENWTNIPNSVPGRSAPWLICSPTRRNDEEVNYLVLTCNILGKLQLILLFFFGALVVCFEHAKKVLRILKPVRVETSIS
ncbi:uncharacterized protein [Typha latifolia]|uniref:uncharacterized protein n=1 Tax=Typha latifolia TaxID=4733 RepID=UPI003C2CC875